MMKKTYIPEGQTPPASQIGATVEALARTIAIRREAGDESYTHRLLTSSPDEVLKKLMEESGEVALAAKDVEAWATSSIAAALAAGYGAASAGAERGRSSVKAERGVDSAVAEPARLDVNLPDEYAAAVDHLRYEAADVVYHLLVVLERYGISVDEFAAELNNRMNDEERPVGAIRLKEECVNRGK